MSETAAPRAHAAALARRYFYERSVPLSVLEETFRDTRDPLIAELVDLAQHEPPSDDREPYTKTYWPHVAAVLQELDRGAAGQLPPMGRWSLAKVMGLAGLAVCSAGIAWTSLRQPVDVYWGTSAAITAVLATIAFFSVLRQYRAQQRRRCR